MKSWFKAAVVALVLPAFVACSSLQPLEDFSPSRIVAKVEPGDEVHIVTLTGSIYDLTVTRVDADSLSGRASSGKRFKIMFEAIQYIEVEEADALKTVGATLLTAYAVLSAILVYAVVVFLDEVGDE